MINIATEGIETIYHRTRRRRENYGPLNNRRDRIHGLHNSRRNRNQRTENKKREITQGL
jgi:hypothetical protein